MIKKTGYQKTLFSSFFLLLFLNKKNIFPKKSWCLHEYCNFGKQCDKINFTYKCEMLEHFKEKYCHNGHPHACYYFEKYGNCKFYIFCSYKHFQRKMLNRHNLLDPVGSQCIREIVIYGGFYLWKPSISLVSLWSTQVNSSEPK